MHTKIDVIIIMDKWASSHGAVHAPLFTRIHSIISEKLSFRLGSRSWFHRVLQLRPGEGWEGEGSNWVTNPVHLGGRGAGQK